MENSNEEDKTNIPILMLGLDEAGKTTILYKLQLGGELEILPTIGYNVETINFEDTTFTIWDIGGRESVRVLWKFYKENKSVVVFVVDVANDKRFVEAKEFLHTVMNDEDLTNAALLIVSNKHDALDGIDGFDLEQHLDLSKLKQKYHIINTNAFDEESLKQILIHIKNIS